MKFKKSFLFILMLLCVSYLGAMEDPDGPDYRRHGIELEPVCFPRFIAGKTYRTIKNIYSQKEKLQKELNDAIKKEDVQEIDYAIKQGADVNYNCNKKPDSLPLCFFFYSSLIMKKCDTIDMKRFKCLKFLLEQGADPDKRFIDNCPPHTLTGSLFEYFFKYHIKCTLGPNPNFIVYFYLMLCFKKYDKNMTQISEHALKDLREYDYDKDYQFLSLNKKKIEKFKKEQQQFIELYLIFHQLIQWRIDFLKNPKNKNCDVIKFNLFVFNQWLKLEKKKKWKNCYSKPLLNLIIDGEFIKDIVFGEKQEDSMKKIIGKTPEIRLASFFLSAFGKNNDFIKYLWDNYSADLKEHNKTE